MKFLFRDNLFRDGASLKNNSFVLINIVLFNIFVLWAVSSIFFYKINTDCSPEYIYWFILFRFIQDIACVGSFVICSWLLSFIGIYFRLIFSLSYFTLTYLWIFFDFAVSFSTGFRIETAYFVHYKHFAELMLASGISEWQLSFAIIIVFAFFMGIINTLFFCIIRFRGLRRRVVASILSFILITIFFYLILFDYPECKYASSGIKLVCDWIGRSRICVDYEKERKILADNFFDHNENSRNWQGKEYPLYRITDSYHGKKNFTIDISKGRPKHVFIIFIESARGVNSGVSGRDRVSFTPFLDQISKEGVTFQNFYANGMGTVRAMFAALYGAMPIFSEFTTQENYSLTDLHGLPQIFLKRRYATFFYNGCNLGFAKKHYFYSNQGFVNLLGRQELCRVKPDCILGPWGVHDESLYSVCLNITRRVDKENGKTFNVILPVSSHGPFVMPGQSVSISTIAPVEERYEKCLRYADSQLKNFIKGLQKNGLYEKSLIVILGDHGVFFPTESERAVYASLREEAVLVPFVILAPGRLQKPVVIKKNVSDIDLLPTIVDIMGFSAVEHHSMGRSLVRKNDIERPVYFFCNNGFPCAGFRYENMKYVLDLSANRSHLFNLSSDINENVDIAERNSEKCKLFEKRVRDVIKLSLSIGMKNRYAPVQCLKKK